MNHLTGLELATGFDVKSRMSEEDLGVFEKFKAEYFSLADPEQRDREPQYLVPSSALPRSGWRPLDDATLWRFLTADRRDGKFQPGKSMCRLKTALAWRRELRVDDMQLRPPPGLGVYQKLRVRPFVGHDRTGRPVQFERIGDFLVSPNWKRYSLDEWIRLYAWDMDNVMAELRKSSARAGRPITSHIYIGDMRGIGIWHAKDLLTNKGPFLGKLAKAVESHSPEMVGTIIVFNLPSVAQRVFKAVSLLLDPVVVSKIEVYSGVPYARFKELMEPEMIPREYGGLNDIHYPPILVADGEDVALPAAGVADAAPEVGSDAEPDYVKPKLVEGRCRTDSLCLAVVFGRGWPIAAGLLLAACTEVGRHAAIDLLNPCLFVFAFLLGAAVCFLVCRSCKICKQVGEVPGIVSGESTEALAKRDKRLLHRLPAADDGGDAGSGWLSGCCCLSR